MPPESENIFNGTKGLIALWAGLLLAPAAWLLQLQTAYTLVPWACAHDAQGISLHLITLVTLVLAGAGGFIAWRSWNKAGKEWPDGEGGVNTRSRFMAILGLLTSAIFFFLILVQGIPSFILHPCQP